MQPIQKLGFSKIRFYSPESIPTALELTYRKKCRAVTEVAAEFVPGESWAHDPVSIFFNC